MPAQKIATCCYCGTRAALVLRGNDRHELSCSSCGAPLHNLKMLPISRGLVTGRAASSSRRTPKAVHPKQPHPKPRKVEKRKKRKGLFERLADDLWDEIEDIFG
jgi:hypothetical protein